MKLRNILAAGILASCALLTQAQIDNLPRKTVNGTVYGYYEVQPKETIYSISRRLGISREEIERYNPSVADGLKAGQTLYFTIEGDSPARTHVVKAKETVYGISRLYGITTEQLLKWNPSAIDGIRTGQTLYVSNPADIVTATVQPAVENTNSGRRTHTIGSQETLYRIALDNNTTVDAILTINPGLDGSHYQAGQVIYLPEPGAPALTDLVTAPAPAVAVDTPAYEPKTPSTDAVSTHRVKKGETFYSIAHSHGITVEELEKANPEVGILGEGMVLNIPGGEKVVEVEEVPVTDYAEASPAQPENPVLETPAPESINIALTLPLMLSLNEQPRQSQLYTEFYKGFLVAVDSMRNCGTPINIQVYDTQGSADTLRTILAKPELAEAGIIIAPDNEAQLAMLGEYGRRHNIDILNLFVVKDETYRYNPRLMQGNIPHASMYTKAINGMINRMGAYTPVLLSRNGGPDDKAEYIKELRETLQRRGIAFKEVVYESSLKESDLDTLDLAGMYAFIPESGRQAELNRVLPAVIEFKAKAVQPDPVRVFGYPEWTTFRGETLLNMHKANSIVYSRFFTVPEDPAVQAVENKYRDWYGAPMANFVPRQGLFGYDTAMFLINAMKRPAADNGLPAKWSGVQNGFDFIRSGNGGMVNDELYFINYRPSGLIDKYSL